MHGSSYIGDCRKVLKDLDVVMKDIWGEKMAASDKYQVH
jgi:hypothetical protein